MLGKKLTPEARAKISAWNKGKEKSPEHRRKLSLHCKWITFNGITDSYVGWSKRTGIKSETISQRIRKFKWDIEKTLTQGVQK